MFGGSSPCSLKAVRSSFEKEDPLLNWDDARREAPSNEHFKGPDAARGKCLNFDAPFRADIMAVICATRSGGDKLMRGCGMRGHGLVVDASRYEIEADAEPSEI